MKHYVLGLLCLIVAVFVIQHLQPERNNCCLGLKNWFAPKPELGLELSETPDNTNRTSSGYVFSLALEQSDIKSTLPDVAPNAPEINKSELPSIGTKTVSDSIISTSTDLNILSNQAKPVIEETSFLSKLFSKSNLVTALILFTASFFQGASGFAFAVLMMPLLVWSGFSLAEASMFTAVNALFITSFMVSKLRNHIKWSILLPTMLLRIGTMAVGILLLSILNTLDRALIRQILGLLLLVIVAIQIFNQIQASQKNKKQEKEQADTSVKLAPYWSWLAFGSGGFLGGMVGFGGPAVALWVVAQNWSSKASRSFLTASYWSILPIQIILLLTTFGKPIADTGIQALYFLPIVLVGVFLGIIVGNKFDKARLRYLVQALLLVTGLASLLAPYLGLT